MDEKIIVALIGLAGGAIGSLFAPWANWGIEKRKQKLAYRRELVAKWRRMISWASFTYTHRPEDDESKLQKFSNAKKISIVSSLI